MIDGMPPRIFRGDLSQVVLLPISTADAEGYAHDEGREPEEAHAPDAGHEGKGRVSGDVRPRGVHSARWRTRWTLCRPRCGRNDACRLQLNHHFIPLKYENHCRY